MQNKDRAVRGLGDTARPTFIGSKSELKYVGRRHRQIHFFAVATKSFVIDRTDNALFQRELGGSFIECGAAGDQVIDMILDRVQAIDRFAMRQIGL